MTRPVSFFAIVKLCMVFGVSLGFIAGPIYAISYFRSGDILHALMSIILAPLVNGVFGTGYGIVGYPAYLYLWRKKFLGMDKIVSCPKL